MDTEYIYVTLDIGKGKQTSFAVPISDYHLVFGLVNRISVPPQHWFDQQRRREEEAREAHRRERERQQREKEQRERERRGQDRPTYNGRSGQYSFFNPGNENWHYSFFEDFIRDQQRPSAGPRPGAKTHKMLLAEMAGVEWAVADLMEIKKLLKRAQRNCHPDTGGSHEKWLKLQKLQEEMRLT